jgi:hypothetical protein
MCFPPIAMATACAASANTARARRNFIVTGKHSWISQEGKPKKKRGPHHFYMLYNRAAQLEFRRILHLLLAAESRVIISYICNNWRKNGALHPITSEIMRNSRELVHAGHKWWGDEALTYPAGTEGSQSTTKLEARKLPCRCKLVRYLGKWDVRGDTIQTRLRRRFHRNLRAYQMASGYLWESGRDAGFGWSIFYSRFWVVRPGSRGLLEHVPMTLACCTRPRSEMGRDGTRSPERETGRLEIPGRERCNVTSRAV